MKKDYYKIEFTLEDAIRIQTEQLLRWQIALKRKKYAQLLEHALQDNVGKTNPNSIFRGTDIDTYVLNHLMNK